MRSMWQAMAMTMTMAMATAAGARSAQAAAHRNDKVYQAAVANRAAALDLLKEIVDIDSGTGDIAGGTRVETVLAARLKALGAEVRTEPAEVPAVLAKVEAGAATTLVADTQVAVTHDPAHPPLTENAQIDAPAARAKAIYAEIGKTLASSGNGGASESALAMAEGTPALDGLGFVGWDFHTDREWIDLSSIVPRLYLIRGC